MIIKINKSDIRIWHGVIKINTGKFSGQSMGAGLRIACGACLSNLIISPLAWCCIAAGKGGTSSAL